MENMDDTTEALLSPLRKSTRKKTQPIHYGHEAVDFSSPQSKNSKESQDSSSSEAFVKDPSHTPDDSSDDDVPLSHYSPQKLKKRTAKQSNKSPSAKKPRSAKKRTKAAHEESFPDKGSLFDIIKGGRVALQTVIDDWIENYNNDRQSAMIDLIQVIIQCCGCKGIVSEDMLEEDEKVNAIRKLTEEFDEDSQEYPLIMSGVEYKRFKDNFCSFISLLIEQCQHSIVYDDYMMEKFTSWLISLSDSQVRAFRHTSTLAGMELVVSLIQVALKVNIELDNTQRQLDSEKRKSAQRRGVQKMEMLQNKKEQLSDNIQQLEEYMNFIFQGIFVHRYRDIRPEIRSLCITEIGNWMKEYSNYFLSHKYLKYVVWTLHDKDGDVRLSALEALHKLYDVEEYLSQLEPLTSRFKGRIVAMTLDIEHTVAVVAIKLVLLLLSYGELDEEDCEQIEQLVFCSQRQIAHEAGAFLNTRLVAENSSPSKKKTSKKSELQRKTDYIKKLIYFFVTSQIHNHASYLVDSLWQHCDLLKDWETMTMMLLDDKFSESLSDDEESALIEIMTCCCRQAATGQGPPGRFVKRLLGSKEKKMIVNDKQEMSGHFMIQLPVLLGKYGTDLPKAENLVTIAQYFDLEEYSERRLGQHFDDLLDQVDDLVQKGPEKSLLEECAKTYRILTDNELTLKSKAEVALNKLIDSIVDLFKEGYRSHNRESARSDDEEGNSADYTLQVNLRRITAFYKNHDLGAWDLWDMLFEIARNGSDEACSDALVSLEMSLLWSVNAMKQKLPTKRQLADLKTRLDSYMMICGDIISNEADYVRKEAFLSASDLMIVFAKQLINNHPSLNSLVFLPNGLLQDTCTKFATAFAFSDLNSEDDPEKEEEDNNTDEEVEQLNTKRVVLAALCKLFSYGIFDMHRATPVFARLLTAFGNFGDIIKHTMSKCREINVKYYTKTLALTLLQEQERLVEEADDELDRTSLEYTALKDLAKRFTLSFGFEITKDPVRKAMINLHREAIFLGLQQDEQINDKFPNIGYFDIMNECTSRLIPVDKKAVLKILVAELTNRNVNVEQLASDVDLLPLYSYYNVLLDGHQTGDKARKGRGPVAQKTKRRLVDDYSKQDVSNRKSLGKNKSRLKKKPPPSPDVEPDVEEDMTMETSPIDNVTTARTSKRKRNDEENEEQVDQEENSEDDFDNPAQQVNDDEIQTSSVKSPQPSKALPRKRSKQNLPDNIFETSGEESQQDDDLPPGLN